MDETLNQVEFRELSQWQKRDCIGSSAKRSCDNPATIEATLTLGSVISCVRCCTDDVCKKKAAELAVTQATALHDRGWAR